MISTLTLTNFRSFKTTRINGLQTTNFFAGENRAGKSGVADALRVLFSGTCRGAVDGKDHVSLRHTLGGVQAPSGWSVKATLEGGDSRAATVVARHEGEGPGSEAQAALEALTGVSGRLARASLDSSMVVDYAVQNATALQHLLVELIKPEAGVQLEERQVELMGRHLAAGGQAELDLAEMDRLYKMAYKLRTDANRKLKQTVGILTAPEGMEALAEMTAAELDEASEKISLRIAERKETLADLTKKRDALTAVPHNERAIEKVELAVVDARESFDTAMTKDKIASETRRLTKLIKDCDEKLATLNKDMDTASFESAKLAAIIEGRCETRSQLVKSDAHCNTCRHPLAEGYKEDVLLKINKEIDANQQLIMDQEDERVQLHSDINKRKSAICDLNKELEELSDSSDAYAKAHDALTKAVEARDAALEENSVWMKGKVDADAGLLKSIEEIGASLDEGRTRLQAVANFQAHQRVAAGAESEKQDAAELHELCELLGPKGSLRAQLTESERTNEFFASLSSYMDAFGFQVDWKPVMEGKSAPMVNERKLSLMSDSERLLFGVAFQIMTAKWSGLDTVIVDWFEHLDGPYAKRAQSMLKGSGCQSFVFSVSRDPAKFEHVAGGKAGMYVVSSVDEVSRVRSLAGQ